MSIAEYLALFDRSREVYEDGRTKMLLGPYGEAWCSDEVFQAVRQKADQTGCGVHLHLLETARQRFARRVPPSGRKPAHRHRVRVRGGTPERLALPGEAARCGGMGDLRQKRADP